MPLLIRPIAMIQILTPGMMLLSPICRPAARPPPRVSTMAGGYLQVGMSTSPLATACSPGIPLPTFGTICQIWYKHAICSKVQRRANPSMLSPGTLYPALLATTTSSTPKPAAPHRHRHQHLRRRRLPPQVRQRGLRRHHDLAQPHDPVPAPAYTVRFNAAPRTNSFVHHNLLDW